MNLKKMFDLNGRIALVTGSSRGIGQAIAMTLADAGAQIIIHASRNDSHMEKTVAAIRNNGGQARTIAADLASPEEVKKLIDAVGELDILVLNASAQSYQSLEDFTPEEFHRQYEVNLRSSFELVQAFVPGMKNRRWGRILAIGSVNQHKPSARLPIYSTTKAALNNLMNNCARQYASFGITVNNLAPGVIMTDRNVDVLNDEAYRNKVLAMIPAGRFGKAEECASLALLLCSDAGSYITGVDISVAGGMQL
ncbi:MAG: SDR family oxidoreductase [Lentisphaerota bacterium]